MIACFFAPFAIAFSIAASTNVFGAESAMVSDPEKNLINAQAVFHEIQSDGSGDQALPVQSIVRDSAFQLHLKEAINTILQERPELIFDVLASHHVEFIDLIEQAYRERAQKEKRDRILQELQNPKQPKVDLHRPIRGDPDAPITIVEYSDFQCPFCRSASTTIKTLLAKYQPYIRFIYKHYPLSFHSMAETAARYFEAIALQDINKAWQFHDLVFAQQERLIEGERYLQALVRSLQIDFAQLAQDLDSEIIEKRLAEDLAEAHEFRFGGTPAFVINGITIEGAQSLEEFEMVINVLKKRDL